MAIDQLSVETFQALKTAAFIAAFFVNRHAIIILAFHLVGERLFVEFSHLGVYYFCMAAALYSINATINIKLSYSIRQALICIGLINWLAAVDYFVSPNETMFYVCYPWLINGLDVFILCVLLGSGGWRRDRIYRSRSFAGNYFRADLQLRHLRQK